jgi:O-antigen ligase
MHSFQKKSAGFLFSLLPLAYLAPQRLSVMGIKIEWFEIVFYFALLLGPPRKGYGLVFPLGLLVGVATFTNITAIIIWGMHFSLHDYKFLKYFVCYLGAIHLGLYLTEKSFNRSDLFALLVFIIFVAMVLASVFSIELRNAIRTLYGMESAPFVLRLRLIDYNPIKIAVTTIILFFFASKGRSLSLRSTLYILSLIPLFLSRQRAGMILITIMFFVLEFPFLKRYILRAILIVVVVLTSLLVSDLEPIRQRVDLLEFNKSVGGVTKRLDIFSESIEGITESVVFGHGHINQRGKNSNFTGYTQKALHNTYLQIFFENGIFGFMVLLYFIIILIHRFKKFSWFVKIRHNDKNAQREKRVFFAFILTYLIAMIGWYTFRLENFSSFYFLIFGYMFAQLNKMRGQHTP